MEIFKTYFIKYKEVLGDAMISVLAIGPRFAGSNPAESDGFLRAIKSAACLSSEEK
jgi:hypothetical protein